ncbi:MAG: hypothetical protein D6705_10705 [Deltaproteobacteria bacterium]|nr:MAG: hypothetical protein D6705_10705 [Deltaproteobacteria bacterium]
MTKHRKRYSPEFKAEAVRLMQTSDKPVAKIAENLGINERSLCRWARQMRIEARDPPRAIRADCVIRAEGRATRSISRRRDPSGHDPARRRDLSRCHGARRDRVNELPPDILRFACAHEPQDS